MLEVSLKNDVRSFVDNVKGTEIFLNKTKEQKKNPETSSSTVAPLV